MKNKRFVIFSVIILSVMIFHPANTRAEETVVVPGIVEVEENHLYMVPIGTDDGVKKGDTIEIVRDENKIADARLISVLSDNSMAEIIVLFARTDVLESDSVRFFKKEEDKRGQTRKTLGSSERTSEEEAAALSAEEAEKRRGLLGSDMHRYEEVASVEGPLKKEIEQLKAGLVSVRDEYEDKVDTILSSVGGEKDALAVEKKWKEKLVSTERRYQAQYNERKRLLEKESARLEAKVAALTNELKVVNEGTDRRIQQLLSDLKDKEDELSALKQEFVEEHLASEKQWKAKIENLEAQYQNQLRGQKEDLETRAKTDQERLQGEITYLKEQVDLVRQSVGTKNDELQVRLKEREDLIESLRKEQFGLESDLNRKSEEARKLESDVATLKDVIAAAKRVHEKELAIARKPLETKLEDMSVEFISVKNDYERELNAARQAGQEDLMENEKRWVEKLASVEQKYQNQISEMNSAGALQVNQLRSELDGQKDVVELLKQNITELTAKLNASEAQYAQSQNEVSALNSQLSVERATRQEKIDLAKRALEDKVAELSSQNISLKREHEKQIAALGNAAEGEADRFNAKISEDASLIEFLNSAMADLTADLEDRDQKIASLEENLRLSQGENAAMKKSHLERIDLAKAPLENEIKSLNGQLIAMKAGYESQIKDIQEDTSKELLVSEERWQSRFEELEQAKAKEFNVQKSQMDEQITILKETIASLEGEHNRELAAVEENKNAEIAALQAQWEEKLDMDAQQWQAKLNASELEYQKIMSEEAAKKQSVIDYLKEEKSGLVAQMAAMQREHDAKIREMEVVARRGQAEINDQWQAKLDAMQKAHKEELASATGAIRSGYEARIKEISDKNSKETANLNEQWQKTVSVLEEETSNLADQIAYLRKDYEEKLAKAENASEQNLSDNNRQWQEKFKAAQEGYKTERNTLLQEKQGLIDRLDAEKTALSGQIKALRRDYEERIAKLSNDANQNLVDKDQQWQAQLAAEKDKHGQELKVLDQQLNDQTNALREELAVQKESYEMRIAKITSEAKEGQAVSDQQWQAQLAKLQDDHQKELNAKLREKQNVIERLQDNNSQLAKQISNLQKDYEAQIAKIKDDSKQNATASETQWQTRINEKEKVITLLEDDKARLKDEVASLARNHQAELKRIEEKSAQDKAVGEERWQAKMDAQKRALEEKIGSLDSQLSFLKKDSNSVIDDLQEQLKKKRDEASDLMKQNTSLSSRLIQSENEVKQYENNVALLTNQLKQAESSRAQSITAVKTPLEEEIKKLNNEIVFLKKNHENEIKSFQENANNDIAALNQKWQEKLDAQQKTYEQKRQLADGRYKELRDSVVSLKEDHQKEIDGLKASGKTDISALEKQHASALEAQRQEWEKKLEDQRRASEQRVDNLTEQLELARNNSDTTIEDLRSQLEERRQLVTTLEKRVSELVSTLENKDKRIAELDNNVARLDGELKATRASYDNQIKVAKQPLEEKVKTLNGEIKSLWDEAKKELKEAEDQWEEKLKTKDAEHKREVKSLNDEIASLWDEAKKELATAEDEWRAELKEKDRELARIRKKPEAEWKEKFAVNDKQWSDKFAVAEENYQNGLKAQEEKLQTQIAELNRQLNVLKSDSSGVIDQLQADLKEKQARLTSLEKENTVFTEDLNRKDNEIAGLRSDINKARDDLSATKREYELKLDKEGPREVARLRDELNQLKGDSDNQIELLKNELKIERGVVADLEREKESLKLQLSGGDTDTKRLELAKDSLEAEVKKLNSELEFYKNEYSQKMEAQKDRLEDDLRTKEDEWQAKLAAMEAQWKTKWAVREAEFQEEKAGELADLEDRIFRGKKDVQETIVNLNNRLTMLKNSSDSQIRELEADLAASQYQLTAREADFQERLMKVDQEWSAKLEDLEKKHMEELAEKKRDMGEDFLEDKKELRKTVIDLTKQFNDLRESSADRIRDLENQIEQKDFKLGLLENQSKQDVLGAEEKWQAKLTAIQERHQRELMEQKQELQKDHIVEKDKMQAAVNDLNRQIIAVRDQAKLDLDLSKEEAAAEVALLERRYQEQLAGLKEGSSDEVADLITKTKNLQDLIDNLKGDKSSLQFDLDQAERELARLRAERDELKKDGKMIEISSSEKLRLSKQSLESQIMELQTQLKITKDRAAQEREEIEELWRDKLTRLEEDYQKRMKMQRMDMQDETKVLANKIDILEDDSGKKFDEMKIELEDNQTLIRILSKEKYDLATRLEEKAREIVDLNEEIVELKEDLADFKEMIPFSSTSSESGELGKIRDQVLALESNPLYDNTNVTEEEYYAVIRKAILEKFTNFDFSEFEGRAGVVKIDFELLANGSPVAGPNFAGTKDQRLKDLLTKCFEDALPFPPFPDNFDKKSQKFSLGISFKK